MTPTRIVANLHRMSDGSPKPLEYASILPWHRRRGAQRWLIALSLFLALFLCWRAAPVVWRQVLLVYWQQQCMTYSAPAGSTADFVPQPWNRFYAVLSPPGAQSSGTAFLHSRTAPNGNTRLIAVDHLVIAVSKHNEIFFVARGFHPGTLFKSPAEIPIGFEQCRMPATKVLAGLVDAADPSHFTIDVEFIDAWDRKTVTVIDGWLRNDDSILLEPRTTPASQPALPPASAHP